MNARDFWTGALRNDDPAADTQLGVVPSPVRPSVKPVGFTLALSFGRNNRDTSPTAHQITIEDLVNRWRDPDVARGRLSGAEYQALDKQDPTQKKRRDDEKNGEWFSAATFGGDGRRCDANVTALSGMTLDFDSGRTTREVIERKLGGRTYVAYTSYSHTPEQQRWRVFIPYSQPISPDLHSAVFQHFQALFDGDVDPKCATPSQIYYTPACPRDAVPDYQCFASTGIAFDPYGIPVGSERRLPSAPQQAISHATNVEQLARIKGALAYLDPDDRKVWIDVGMAMKRELGDEGMGAWLEWSQRSPKFGMEDAVRTWHTLVPTQVGSAITLATLFYQATHAGWKGGNDGNGHPAIAELNEKYFIAPYGNKVPIFREETNPASGEAQVTPMHPADFRLLLANRRVEDGTGKTGRAVSLATQWIEHPGRRQYAGVVFAPGTNVPGYYNLWRGFAVAPKQGSWKLFRWHLYAVICNRNRQHYRYLLNWLAYAVQNPGVPPGVAIVLKGGRGVGKGIAVTTFGRLFGPTHFRHISNPRHLIGNFNAHLQGCVLLFVDEGYWAGDKAGEGVLKQLITEPTIAIERKGFDVVSVANALHVMVASNSDWVVPAGPDERRFMVLDVSGAKQQDPAYFNPLIREINDGGLEAMLYDLQRRDLRKFDVRRVPRSQALGEQKLQSLYPHHRWWMDKLVEGRLISGEMANLFNDWGPVSKAALHDDYVNSLKRLGVPRHSTSTELGMLLPKLLPDGWPKTSRKTDCTGKPVASYEFPDLDVCRLHFEKLMRLEGMIDWNKGEIVG